MSSSVASQQPSCGGTMSRPSHLSPVFSEHHDGQGRGSKSPANTLLPKKERIRLGRRKDKQRIQQLQDQLRAQVDANLATAAVPNTTINLQAAVRASMAAATASALKLGASADQAEALAREVRQALIDVAPVASDPVSEPDSTSSDADYAAEHFVIADPMFDLYGDLDKAAHPESEAVASEALGDAADAAAGCSALGLEIGDFNSQTLANTVEPLSTAKAAADGAQGMKEEDFNSQTLANTVELLAETQPLPTAQDDATGEVQKSGDFGSSTMVGSGEPLATSRCQPLPTAITAVDGTHRLPSFHPHCSAMDSVKGVGPPLTTPSSHTTGVAGLGHEVDRVIATSLSDDFGFSLNSSIKNEATYSEKPDEQCGQLATANKYNEAQSAAIVSSVVEDDFNSKDLAKPSAGGPLPETVQTQPVLFDAIAAESDSSTQPLDTMAVADDYKSQNLALSGTPSELLQFQSSQHGNFDSGPIGSTAGAQSSTGAEAVASAANGVGISILSSGAEAVASAANGLGDELGVEKLKVSEVLDVVTRALPKGLPDTTALRVQEYFQKFATSDFYASVDACHRNEVLMQTLDMFLSDCSNATR